MPKRPVGVVVVAVVLGLMACFMLLMTAVMLFTAFSAPHLAAAGGAPQPAMPALIMPMLVAIGVFYALIAGWAIATLVGLWKLKNWARYSALVMGGLLAFLGLASLSVVAILPRLLAASPQGASMPPGAMQGLLIAVGLVYGLMAALGVWWLVYFNLRSVKMYFLPGYGQGYGQSYTQNGGMPMPYADPALNPYLPSRASQAESLATPGGLAMGTMGQLATAPLAPGQYPQAYLPPVDGKAHAPTAVTVVGCIFLLACLSCALMAFIPLPAFMLGALITGVGVPILYGCLSLLSGYIGLGLIKLWNGARLATFAFLGFGSVNLMFLLLPSYRDKLLAYQEMVNVRMGLPSGPNPIQQEMFRGPFLVVILIFSLALYGVVFWILHKYRGAFRKTAV